MSPIMSEDFDELRKFYTAKTMMRFGFGVN